jgi:hypothetical protein
MALVMALAAGCSNASDGKASTATATSRLALTGAPASRLVPWGDGAAELGLRAAVPERDTLGAPAVAIGPSGALFVLDAVKQRIVRVDAEVTQVASVSRDADDLALGSDGAFAVRRTMTPKILVLDPSGNRIGEVDAGAVGDVDTVALGPSRRVVVRTAFQESFQLGSPSAPPLPEAVARSRKVGADLLASGEGVVVVAKDGEVELRVMTQAADQEGHAEVRATWSLGRATAARVVGVSERLVCLRLEHVDTASTGPLSVTREARCLDTSSGATVFRADLPAPGLYVPRRELTFAHHLLVFAHPEREGLRLQTWTVEGGAR